MAVAKKIEPTGEGLVDVEKLESIRGLTDPNDEEDFLDSLIRMFLERAPNIIAALKTSIANEQWHQASRDAHALKGTSGNLGASALMHLCAAAEQAGQANQGTELQRLYEEIQSCYQDTAAYMLENWVTKT